MRRMCGRVVPRWSARDDEFVERLRVLRFQTLLYGIQTFILFLACMSWHGSLRPATRFWRESRTCHSAVYIICYDNT